MPRERDVAFRPRGRDTHRAPLALRTALVCALSLPSSARRDLEVPPLLPRESAPRRLLRALCGFGRSDTLLTRKNDFTPPKQVSITD